MFSRSRTPITALIAGSFFFFAIFGALRNGFCQGNGPDSAFSAELQAAGQGDVRAQIRIGTAYYFGYPSTGSFKPDYAEAFEWLQAAHKQGSAEATALLGRCYLFGLGAPADRRVALDLIRESAETGDPTGQTLLGWMYERGVAVPQDYSRAITLYSTAMAERHGNAFYFLGNLYLKGLGVAKNEARAMMLFEEGAKLGDADAEFNLARMYELGYSLQSERLSYVPKHPDYPSAMRWYSEAAAQGNREALYQQGRMSEEGRGTPRDVEKSIDLYREAGHRGYAPAQLAMGEWHERQGNDWHIVNAYAWYAVAAEQGNEDAMQRLKSLKDKMTSKQVEDAMKLLAAYTAVRPR